MKSTIVRWGAAALMVGLLVGCGGGGGGSNDTAAAAPGAGAGAGAGAVPPAATTTIATAVALPANDTATTPTAAFTVVQNAGIAPVTINSPPKVNFTVASDGAVVKGLTASNVSVIIAKLVPGTKGSPDQWVSYTNRTEKATATVGPGGKPALASAPQATTDSKQTDAALLAAQLTYNDAGYYTYTFSTDIKDPTKTNGVTFEPSLTHRVALQLSYTNKAGATVLVNPYFDFTIDAQGNAVAVTDTSSKHKVVDITSCNQCHGKLALHGGGRVDTQYCVLCHSAATTDANSGNVLDLRIMAHKIHAGKELNANFGVDYTIWGYKDGKNSYAEVGFPQDLRNCTTCHDNTKAPQADNWKNVPSRAACGSCHAGINFATGKGTTMAGSTIGHIGGAKADDSQCVLCHDATTIPTYHIPVTPPDPGNALNTAGGNTHSYSESIDGNQNNLPQGAIKISWDLQSVSRNASKQPVMVFRLLQNGARADFNTYSATGKKEIWDNFFGSPSLYFVFAVPQDGITAPADFNASISTYLRSLWNGSATGTSKGTLSGPDASGYYTATLTGVTVPDNAVMLTGGIGYTYGSGSQPLTQMNVSGYPVTASPVDATKNVGGLAVVAPNVSKVATGYTARRAIVENARCNKCHENLGVFTAAAFHSGQRNDAPTCSWCHNPNRTSGGWSADSEVFVHAIHGASKRGVAYTWAAASATDNFSMVGYPGILKNCETCHLPGTYDFSASASASAMPNRLYRTAATGTTAAATFSTSPYIAQTAGTAYGSGFSFAAATGVTTAAAGATLVNSPIAAACFSCHDSDLAKSHMTSNGGSLYDARTAALAKTEQCTLCHLAGKVADIKAMHAK